MSTHPDSTSLRIHAPRRVLDGFGGGAVRASCRHVAPRSHEELLDSIERARREGLRVTFRGAGRSYGDAALNEGGLVVDTQAMRQMRSWDPVRGIVDGDPGLTIEDLWRRTIEDGYWPAVVPGTMAPTLAGCLSTNVHGKNHYRAGSFGDHVLDFDLATSGGEVLRCSRDDNPDVFRGAIGGMGLLGAITRVRMKLRKVETGLVTVTPLVARHLDEMFALFEERLPDSDYLVGWMDCLAPGGSLGRGVIHAATYLRAEDDVAGRASLHVENQRLSPTIAGLSRAQLWRLMRLFTHDPGVRFVNALKFLLSRLGPKVPYRQSHVAFAFLLDQVSNWRLSYGRDGFVQCQVFLPAGVARGTLGSVLRRCQQRRMPPYLGVLKRHRADEFLLSHALEGWSLAMDFRVTDARRNDLSHLLDTITEEVLDAGGHFYFAKDAHLTASQTARAYGAERLRDFARLRARLDPDELLSSNLSRRVLSA